ncbi:MAG: hypothetical protein ACTSRT_20645 [Promethearchaeota archaeon]
MEKTTKYGIIFIILSFIIGSISSAYDDLLLRTIIIFMAFIVFIIGYVSLIFTLDKRFINKSKKTRIIFWIFSIFTLILILFIRIGMFSHYANYLFPNNFDPSWFMVASSVFYCCPIFLILMVILLIVIFIDRRKIKQKSQ